MISILQSKVGSATPNITLDSATTPGSVLVCGTAMRDGGVPFVAWITPTLTDSGEGPRVTVGDPRSGVMGYRVCDGTESVIAPQFGGGPSSKTGIWAIEIAGVDGSALADHASNVLSNTGDRRFWKPGGSTGGTGAPSGGLDLIGDGILVSLGWSDTGGQTISADGLGSTLFATGQIEGSPEFSGTYRIILGGGTALECYGQVPGNPDNYGAIGIALNAGAPPVPNGGIIAVVA